MRRSFVRLQHYGAPQMAYAMAPNSGQPDGPQYFGGTPPLTSMSRTEKIHLDPLSFVKKPPTNKLLNIVPQGHEYVVERLGRYHRTLGPGFWFVIPFIDKIRYSYNVKEQGIEIPNQFAITSDNVIVDIDGVLFLQIIDSQKASYNIENPIYNLINLAQTTMRNEIGRINLDALFRERSSLNRAIVEALRREASEWGVECKRYEIRDIVVSELVRRSMDLQAEAERRKRKLVLESEGEATAEINRATSYKTAQELAADAQKYTTVKNAEAEAESIVTKSYAVAENLHLVSSAVKNSEFSREAMALRVAEKYIDKFGELAKTTNTVVLSQPVGDPATFSAQALSVFQAVSDSTKKKIQ